MKVRRLRQLAGMTVAELAEETHISRSYMYDIELGTKNPSAPVFARLCDALGIARKRRAELLRADSPDATACAAVA